MDHRNVALASAVFVIACSGTDSSQAQRDCCANASGAHDAATGGHSPANPSARGGADASMGHCTGCGGRSPGGVSPGGAPADSGAADRTDIADGAVHDGAAGSDAGAPDVTFQPSACTMFADLRVDGRCDTYDAAARSCAGGSKRATKTIVAAMALAAPGDVVCVRAGDYDENVAIDKSGRDGALITLAAYPGEECRGDIGQRRTDCRVRITGANARVHIHASYVALQGFSILPLGSGGYVLEMRGSDHVTVQNCNLDGNFHSSDNQQTGGVCSGVSLDGSSYVTFDLDEIHDNADDGLELNGTNHLLMRHNEVHGLHACGTDDSCVGPCYNGHSDGFEGTTLDDAVFDGNFVYDVNSTSAMIYGWVGHVPNTRNFTLINNIFYTPETGFAIYLQGIEGAHVYNNVFWGRTQGAYGGFAMGLEVTGFDMENNIILSVNYAHMGATYDPAEHKGDYNVFGADTGQYPTQAHDVVADPKFVQIPRSSNLADFQPYSEVRPEFFRLSAASPARGKAHASANMPDHDFYGKPRRPTANIGAIE